MHRRTHLAAAILVQLAWVLPAGAVELGAISAGSLHSCGVTTTGGVKCWGYNFWGQLGDGNTGSTSPSFVAADVAGLASGIAAASAGGSHTCALTAGGGVKCWGADFSGQLGDGTSGAETAVPADVVGLTNGVAAVNAGSAHTCALTASGGVKCWGYNLSGQLGDGSNANSAVPVDVAGLTSGVAAASAGGLHTCALTTSGGVKCWGANVRGQLGDGTNSDSSSPVDVTGLTSGVAGVVTGDQHSCALLTGGGVKCWGYNLSGQLGDGSTIDSPVPVGVSGLSSGIATLSAGVSHTCALTTGGGIKCWGSNGNGQLGDGGADSPIPVDVAGLASGVSVVSAGGFHTCAVTAGGAGKCWGNNDHGELGDGSTTFSSIPLPVSALPSGVLAVAAGSQHSCVLGATGGVKCWGANAGGQLGDGTNSDSPLPVDVSGLASGVAAVSAGSGHTCALTTAGGVKCWGQNQGGQLGDGTTTDSYVPVDVTGLSSDVSALSLGNLHSCALTTAGGVKCWGDNFDGQLGDGTYSDSSVPVDVSGLSSGVAAIDAGHYHTCAVTVTGGAKCWGDNNHGVLGNGTTTDSSVPIDVSGLSSGVIAVSAGGGSGGSGRTCAVTSANGLKCWGANFDGQLGDGTTMDRFIPVDVSGLSSSVAAVDVGRFHTCALRTFGMAQCWGDNSFGQLGNGSTTFRRRPRGVFGSTNDVAAISTYGDHTCALTSGGVSCWGENLYGELGDGSDFQSLVPKDVFLPGDLCPPAPASGCRSAARTLLSLEEVGGQRDTLWKWTRGEPTNPTEFGNPMANARYALCLYDAGGLALAQEEIGWNCAGKAPCWKVVGLKGFRYRNRDPRPDRQKIVLTGSDDNRSKILAMKKDEAFTAAALPFTAPVTAQWHNTRTDTCWEAVYTGADVLTSTAAEFKARTRP